MYKVLSTVFNTNDETNFYLDSISLLFRKNEETHKKST